MLAYPAELNSKTPFRLLETTPQFLYQAQSGLIGPDGPDQKSRPVYSATQQEFILGENQDELRVPMTFVNEEGVKFVKTFILKKVSMTLVLNTKLRTQQIKH